MSALSKLYSDSNDKYKGTGDSLRAKCDIFFTYCQQAGVPQEALSTAFPHMLKEDALQFYHSNQYKTNMSIQQLFDAFKVQYEGPTHDLFVLKSWNRINLKETIEKNPNKSHLQALDIIIYELRQLNLSLLMNIQTDNSVYTRLLLTYEGVPAL